MVARVRVCLCVRQKLWGAQLLNVGSAPLLSFLESLGSGGGSNSSSGGGETSRFRRARLLFWWRGSQVRAGFLFVFGVSRETTTRPFGGILFLAATSAGLLSVCQKGSLHRCHPTRGPPCPPRQPPLSLLPRLARLYRPREGGIAGRALLLCKSFCRRNAAARLEKAEL